MLNYKLQIKKLILNSQLLTLNSKGFTYIEAILYIAIVTLMMNALVSFAWNIINNNARSSTQQEISSQGRYVSERILYEIRNASDLNAGTSTFGTNPGTLSLAETVSANNPTIITVTSGKATIKLGAATAVNLNSNDTTVTNLVFTNNTSADNKTKNISFTLTLQSNTTSNRADYIGSITIQSTGEIRSN
ncbi:hypothetical protein HY025_05170 [Candidatus Daviesbacteria bacterium]|nr:hypothetical protein [Candidatus Daviesbacteria bacterium]